MKKIALLAALMMVFSTGFAMAATWKSGDFALTDTNDDDLTIKLSNNVSLNYDAATNGLGYSVATYHSSGTRTFASSSGDAQIFWYDGTQQDPPSAPTGTASAAFDSNWNAL
ncbi:hypothetical protein EDC39_101103 [Geothermobacter ehrlichii]|uniref:Uncharacterized protein n=1 Tax=Geothermobacter ehrlichii TaxID=213224 RepID=A0A5D3WNN1_9BACT|nr:hypothetical protein [Geothermobacter ehrlichii]TYO99943.1 hypothetical protein EDC39_101103 [Geothermobacter ehrlichii]